MWCMGNQRRVITRIAFQRVNFVHVQACICVLALFQHFSEMVKAWYIDQPAKVVSIDKLRSLGILYRHIPADTYKEDGKLEALCKERNYKNRDEVS